MSMKKITQTIKCFFGFHIWEEGYNSVDPDNHTRECKHCEKLQGIYMGDWFTINKKNVRDIEKEYGSIKDTD